MCDLPASIAITAKIFVKGVSPGLFLRSVAPLCEKIIFAFERSYITSAMRKSMLNVQFPGSF